MSFRIKSYEAKKLGSADKYINNIWCLKTFLKHERIIKQRLPKLYFEGVKGFLEIPKVQKMDFP